MSAAPPAVNRRIVETLLTKDLPGSGDRRLLLVHGRYDPTAPAEFAVTVEGAPRPVRVTEQRSVLGIVEAWQTHRETRPGDEVLVVTTGMDDPDLPWDLRGHAVRGRVRSVDRVEVLKDRFGAGTVDPRIWQDTWIVDALLDAEPATGWTRAGAVLTRDAAMRALIGARLGTAIGEGELDAETMLAWSRTAGGPARFAALGDAERQGLTGWLTDVIGDTARVVLLLAAAGRAEDAMALGLLGTAITDPNAAFAVAGLLGGVRVRPEEMRTLSDAVQGTLERWAADAAAGRQADVARQRVLDVGYRADQLAAGAGLTEAVAGNRFLPSGFQARLRTLAGHLSPTPTSATVRSAEQALGDLLDHVIARLHPERELVARMAVRLVRWLAEPAAAVDSVAGALSAEVTEWGWVDRALNLLWAGDAVGDPEVGAAYHAVYRGARARRDALDERFAERLAGWARTSSPHAPGGCLLIEDVLATLVVPLAQGKPGGAGAPLVVVLDGMSAAVAVELGERLATRAWYEIAPGGVRVGAVAAVPSVTRVSRACLLTGTLISGDQAVERAGFAAFWQARHREATLFHKGEIAGGAGHRLAEPLIAALAGDGVVGVVLNTIDDALDHGRQGDRVVWSLSDITYLPELLDTARGYGRPVVLVADHGHILERADGTGLTAAEGVESARWRIGTARAGEVTLAGPRVLAGGGSVVVPWREDIRYTHRKGGYHGGAALAEMTVPILVLVPELEVTPDGWTQVAPETVAPAWWNPPRGTDADAPPPPTPARKSGRGKARPVEESASLFTVDGAAEATSSLGARIVATTTFAAQRSRVPRAPDKGQVAAVIDALVEADNRLSVTVVAAKAGRPKRDPELVARTLERLLNVEGYPVLSIEDDGRTVRLDADTLRLQFGLGSA